MMGSYCYYDTNFTEDLSAELHVHDCMWSGECYACQSARVTFSGTSVIPVSNGTIPITVGTGSGYITLTSTNAPLGDSLRKPAWPQETIRQASPNELDSSSSEDTLDENLEDEEKSSSSEQPPIVPKRASVRHQTPARSCTNHAREKHSLKHTDVSPSDNKKLRHREVEKNRHRQLQAMVKTLSDKIPGKLDKETQVQTMKRAARYCVYLREVLNLLSNTDLKPNCLKEKFEMIYVSSCDNVEMIMSQSGSK